MNDIQKTFYRYHDMHYPFQIRMASRHNCKYYISLVKDRDIIDFIETLCDEIVYNDIIYDEVIDDIVRVTVTMDLFHDLLYYEIGSLYKIRD